MKSPKLMVLESAWHYRKATYWDMPKCATCDNRNTDGTCDIIGEQLGCVHALPVPDDLGCLHHSEIEQPTKAE